MTQAVRRDDDLSQIARFARPPRRTISRHARWSLRNLQPEEAVQEEEEVFFTPAGPEVCLRAYLPKKVHLQGGSISHFFPPSERIDRPE